MRYVTCHIKNLSSICLFGCILLEVILFECDFVFSSGNNNNYNRNNYRGFRRRRPAPGRVPQRAQPGARIRNTTLELTKSEFFFGLRRRYLYLILPPRCFFNLTNATTTTTTTSTTSSSVPPYYYYGNGGPYGGGGGGGGNNGGGGGYYGYGNTDPNSANKANGIFYTDPRFNPNGKRKPGNGSTGGGAGGGSGNFKFKRNPNVRQKHRLQGNRVRRFRHRTRNRLNIVRNPQQKELNRNPLMNPVKSQH